MKRQVEMVSRGLKCFLIVVIILWGVGSVEAQTIGKTVDKSNVQEYKSLLIPALYRAVERGDFVLQTGNLNFPYRHWDRFLVASEKNAGKFALDPKTRWATDKQTGTIVKSNIYGFPFPKIDPKDPEAGDKIIWNFNFQKYRTMGTILHNNSFTWVGKGDIGAERYVNGHLYYLFFQGRPPGQELKNPQNYLSCEMIQLTDPMSVKGTNNMSWDFFDERDIAQFAYVPAIRRTRQTSGASRSDPYMGSDGWLDLQYMWNGKHNSMTWKLVGERTALVPMLTTTKAIGVEAPDGSLGWDVPPQKYGYMTKGWKGASWAPTNATWVPRPVWVIEQMPLSPYYNWGLHINYVDKETSVIFLKEVYDRAGQFHSWVYNLTYYAEGPSGNNSIGDYMSNITDEKIRHGSLSGSTHVDRYIPSSKIGSDFFTLSHFLQLSK